MLTVNDLYLLSSSKNIPLLSNYSSDFWNEYVSKYAEYDSLFRRMFYSFIYFMQFDEQPDTVLSNFVDDNSPSKPSTLYETIPLIGAFSYAVPFFNCSS